MKWITKSFNELTVDELYKIIQLRIDIFVVEQNCPYRDCDDKDLTSYHLMGFDGDKLVAYLRILPRGLNYEEVSLGRVVVRTDCRGKDYGTMLMKKGVEEAERLFDAEAIRISAQNHLRGFYGTIGFTPQSDIYLEDNIPHVEMLRIKG